MKKEDITVIICCAGMGTRLGIGYPKALMDIDGKPLIIRILENLKEYNDIRIVVGFQAEMVIKTVKEYRNDIMFVFNYDFSNTGIVDSINKALPYSREYIVEIDGDLLIEKKDFKRFIEFPGECIGITTTNSEHPIFAKVEDNKVVDFPNSFEEKEWIGLVKLKQNKMFGNGEFLYRNISKYLPLDYCMVSVRDIDTAVDYEKAIEWFLENEKERNKQ